MSACAAGAVVLGDARYLEAGQRAAGFVWNEMRDAESGKLQRSWRGGGSGIPGFCADYAFFIRGLLDLYQAEGDLRWLERARHLQERQDALFRNEAGGYFDSEAGDESILVRMVEDYDGAEPSANSVAMGNLMRLGACFPGSGYGKAAEQLTAAFAEGLARSAVSMPGILAGWMGMCAGFTEIAVTGGIGRAELLSAVHAVFEPWKLLLHCDTPGRQQFLSTELPHLSSLEARNGRAALSLCRDGACQMPVYSPEEVALRHPQDHTALRG